MLTVFGNALPQVTEWLHENRVDVCLDTENAQLEAMWQQQEEEEKALLQELREPDSQSAALRHFGFVQ